MQHNGDWAYGPLMKACCICSITTRMSAATFLEKSVTLLMQQTLSSTHLCVCVCVKRRAVFFQSLLALWVNGYYGEQTNKQKISDYGRWNLCYRLKDNEMEIFEIITLNCEVMRITFSLLCFTRREWHLNVLIPFVLANVVLTLVSSNVRVKRAKLLLCWSESDVSWSGPVTRVPIALWKSSMKGLMWACSSELYLYICAQSKEDFPHTHRYFVNCSECLTSKSTCFNCPFPWRYIVCFQARMCIDY